MRPIGNRILIEPSPAKEKSPGGIVTPEAYRQRDVSWDGIVKALPKPVVTESSGDGKNFGFTETRYRLHDVKVGDRVLVNRYNAVTVDTEPELWLVKPEDIIAILEYT